MTTAQIIFAIPFALIALAVVWFTFYVISTTVWGDRWVRKGRNR